MHCTCSTPAIISIMMVRRRPSPHFSIPTYHPIHPNPRTGRRAAAAERVQCAQEAQGGGHPRHVGRQHRHRDGGTPGRPAEADERPANRRSDRTRLEHRSAGPRSRASSIVAAAPTRKPAPTARNSAPSAPGGGRR